MDSLHEQLHLLTCAVMLICEEPGVLASAQAVTRSLMLMTVLQAVTRSFMLMILMLMLGLQVLHVASPRAALSRNKL